MNSDSLEDFSDQIPGLCAESGLSEEQLSERAGIDVKTLRKIRGGHQTTSRTVIQSLRNAARLAVLEKNIGQSPLESLKETSRPVEESNVLNLLLSVFEKKHAGFDRVAFLTSIINKVFESGTPPDTQLKMAHAAAQFLCSEIERKLENQTLSEKGKSK